jgi:8-oxo-dGTP pyrophosphatase MutT (NUDIX family)
VSRRKAVQRARKGNQVWQVGVLAYRRDSGGALELLLITTRRTQRFMIPKGWRMKGKSEARSAGEEAKEEAGVVGALGDTPIGQFQYWKRLRAAFVLITVRVFAMEVDRELSHWREKGQRRRAWLKPEHAAALVDEPALSAILLDAPENI